jgi:acetyl-CoA synthetase (ADP-forming)
MMEGHMSVIDRALKEGRSTLSEYESKQLLAAYQIPVTSEELVNNPEGLLRAAHKIGYPVVIKGCAAQIVHKTEKGLIRVDVRNDAEARTAFEEIMAGMNGAGDNILVQEMVKGQRELVVGLNRDPQFGPCVMFGLGGIFTEILKDIVFRIAPLKKRDALEMMQDIQAKKILEPIRGMPAADKDLLADMLMTVGRIGLELEMIKEIDINPIIISAGKPVAVDALVILDQPKA